MFCHKCGGPLVNGALFCSYCGAGTPRGNFQDQARGQRKQPALVHRPDHRLYQNPNLLQRQGHYKPNLQQQQGPQLYHQPPLELQQTRPVYQTTHYIAKQETLTTSTTAVYYQGNPMGGGTVLPTGQCQAMIMQQNYANYSQGYHTQSQGQPSSFPPKPSRRNQGLPHSDYQDQVDKLPRKPAPKQPQPRSYTQKQQTSGQAKNKALRKPQEASSEKRT
ncbi:nuclear transcription factor Y subunit beta-like isoform X1 [Dreissena polymorpha]|uniref:Zinc-ribbon domain-containing protein n=1 Tax=Dreissena polymorpha TaxID=45954 RepID=A0A9D4IE96_DREPO|nr:nuclear transcription factor Y subunit beta-like isoform X1 [Dreissena polymorpha]KAH3770720.1 hypothetical protein DPMN_172013 [Dreissena polymorpha]